MQRTQICVPYCERKIPIRLYQLVDSSICRYRFAISIAVTAASAPLLPCFRASTFNRLLNCIGGDNAINHGDSCIQRDLRDPLRAFVGDKVEVRGRATNDRTDTDNRIISPFSARRFAVAGISNEPGVQQMSTSFWSTPWRLSASSAPSNNLVVIKLLNRLTTTPTFRPGPIRSPS